MLLLAPVLTVRAYQRSLVYLHDPKLTGAKILILAGACAAISLLLVQVIVCRRRSGSCVHAGFDRFLRITACSNRADAQPHLTTMYLRVLDLKSQQISMQCVKQSNILDLWDSNSTSSPNKKGWGRKHLTAVRTEHGGQSSNHLCG